MIKHAGIRTIATLLCLGTGTLAFAHPLLLSVSDHHNSSLPVYDQRQQDQMLFALPQSSDSPKLWSEMTPKERADIWPYLTPRMQRFYWRSMTDPERRQMRAEFSPSVKEKFRKRYVSPDNCGNPEHAQRARYRLSPEERQRMREQIREMHIEFYRFHHRAPTAQAADVPPPPELPTPNQ